MNRQYQGFFWGAVVALTVATSAFAGWNPDTKTYDTTGYVKLTTGDSGYSDTTCFEKPASWTWPASYGRTPAAMDPNADYCYNSTSRVSRTPNTRDFTFNARTLAVNGQFHQSSVYYFTTPNMHLLNDGQFVLWGTYSRFSNCTFTVYSDAAHAFKFNVAVDTGTFTAGFTFLNTTIKGEEGAVMTFHGDRATQKAATFWWTGDGSQFYGTAIVEMPNSTVGGYSRLYLGPVNFAGTLVLTNGSQLANYESGTVKVAKLDMKDNSSLLLNPASGGVEVTTALTTDDDTLRVKFDLGSRPNGAAADWTALTAPRGSFSSETLTVTDANGAALPDWATVCVVDEGEVTKLVLHRQGLVKLATVRDSVDGSPFIEQNKDCWSDGELPHPGADYLIDKGNFYFPDGRAPYTFPGDSLTMEKGATANCYGSGIQAFVCPDLRVNNAVFRAWGHDFSLGGGSITLDGKVTFLHYGGRASVFSVDSELVGSGDVTCNSYVSVEEQGSCGQLALTALNTNFTGKIKVTIPSGTKDYGEVPALTRMTTLHVNDPRNLGGALATFTPDALQLEQMSLLRPAATMTLDTPNRGIRVSGMGRIDVPKRATLAVANPITYAGTLRKEGEGTLVLAAASLVEPSADGGNRLEIAEGNVMASATNILDGVEVTTGEEGALVFGINPSGEGMREYGLMGVGGSVGEGADATMGGATINVAFDVSACPDAPPENNWAVALFTVPTAQAETLKSRIQVPKAYPRYAVDLSVRENGDGTSTILATHVCRAYTIDAATCETALPLFRGEGEVTVPHGVHLDFTGFEENGFLDRPFTIARGGSLALPPDFEDWTCSPAVDGYGLVLDVVDNALIASVKKCETVRVRPKGQLLFSGFGEKYPFYMNVTAKDVDGKTTGTYKADGDVYAYGEGSYGFTNVTEIAGEVFDGVVAVRQQDYRTVRTTWSVTPNVDITRVRIVGVNLTFPMAGLLGGVIRAGNREYEFPESGKIFGVMTDEVEFRDKDGVSLLTLKFDRVRYVYAGGGATAGSMKIYHYDTDEPDGYFAAGRASTITFDISASVPVKADRSGVEVISAEDGGWVPVTAHEYVKPGSPLDFSDICGTGKPAGKFGRVVRVGDHFEFANLPGVEQRFHGLTSGAATFSYADEPVRDAGLADLARRGYNATRIHDYESAVVDPDDSSQTTLGEEQMRLFDGYIAASVSNGLYVILELYGNVRKPSWRSIGVDVDGAVTRDEAKMLLTFHEGMISNQMVYLRNYLTHVNRYTGRSFIDEPAIIGADLVNEIRNWVGREVDDTFMSDTARQLILDVWRAYVDEKKTENPEKYADVDGTTIPTASASTAAGRLYVQFLREKSLAAGRQMMAFLRDELGFQGVLTGSPHYPLAAWVPVLAEISDYSDEHFYDDHPEFIEEQFKMPSTFRHSNQNPINGSLAKLRRCRGIPETFACSLYGYPFVMTEFNYVAPSQYRMAGGLLMGSAAALQSVDGLWQHAYSFNTARERLSWFNYISDPLMPAWSRAILTLFARGDMRPLTENYVTRLDPAAMCSDDAATKSAVAVAPMPNAWASWYRKTDLLVADENSVPAGLALSGDWATTQAKTEADVMADLGIARDANGKLPVAGDGQVKIDDVDGSIMVNTPRTAGGFAENGVIEGGALRAETGKMPTAIWVSTLGDGQSIGSAKRLLLTHLTDVQDEGFTYLEKTRQTQLKYGQLPHLMRHGVAEVELTVGAGAYFVYALSGDGERRFTVPSTKDGNVLRFTADIGADPSEATYLYEIVRPRGAAFIYR